MDAKSIGVYDSGVGGLTVVKAIMSAAPGWPIVYCADTARVPYGEKPREHIIRFAREIISFLAAQGAAVVACACNTSSALALPVVGAEYGFPVVGMIEPGARAAVRATRNGRIGVIATTNTARSRAYAAAIGRIDPLVQVFEQACPLLVPMIEQGEVSGGYVREVLSGYLAPLVRAGVDTVVYGCTHYPYLEDEVRAVVGPHVSLVDPAVSVAATVRAALDCCTGRAGVRSRTEAVSYRFFTSGDPEEFRRIARVLLGWELEAVDHVTFSAPRPCWGVQKGDKWDAAYDTRE
ncbi:MAG: glutamate racemase [Firmicutes bacterium]|jgi:glutamate racemase|nr:glutamate racemase [Bacillota bacterium]